MSPWRRRPERPLPAQLARSVPRYPGEIHSYVVTGIAYGGMVTLTQHPVTPAVAAEVDAALRELGARPASMLVPESVLDEAARLVVPASITDWVPAR